jgi:hypothetical protein
MIDDFQSISDDDICRGIVSLDDGVIAISGIAESGTFVGYYENKQLIARAQGVQQKEQRLSVDYLQDILRQGCNVFVNTFLANENALGKIGYGLIQYKQLYIMFFPITHKTDNPPRILVIAAIANSNTSSMPFHEEDADITYIIKKVDQFIKNNL